MQEFSYRFPVGDAASGLYDDACLFPFKQLRMDKIHHRAGIVHGDAVQAVALHTLKRTLQAGIGKGSGFAAG